jgi:hypothetical protein
MLSQQNGESFISSIENWKRNNFCFAQILQLSNIPIDNIPYCLFAILVKLLNETQVSSSAHVAYSDDNLTSVHKNIETFRESCETMQC